MISLFILGAILGSFINAWAFRLGTGMSVFSGRSQCDSCSYTLTWYDLIPVASFVVLRGKCRACESGLSLSHPIVEVITGVLFALSYMRFGLSLELFIVLVSLIFIVALTIYDIKHTIIPNEYVYPLIILSFLSLFISGNEIVIPTPSDILSGPLFFVFFGFLWLVSKGTWMGFGDAKLVLALGWLLGLGGGLTAVILSFWIGSLGTIGYMVYERIKEQRDLTFKSQVPFAPFLIAGFLIVLLSEFMLFPWIF